MSKHLFLLFSLAALTCTNPDLNAQKKKTDSSGRHTSQKKERYNISIVLPIDEAQLKTEKARPLMSFYEGIRLGLEQLDNEPVMLDVQVHMFDQTNMQTFNNFAYSRELKQADLIIAPASGKIVEDIARFAKEHQINFVSAISPFSGNVEENEYFHIVQPTLNTNIAAFTRYSKSVFPKNKKIIIFDKAKENTQDIRNGLSGDRNVVSYDMSFAPFDVSSITRQLSPDEPTVIFVNELNPQKTTEILKVLTRIPTNYQIEVFGMPTLYLNPMIKGQATPNITYYYTTPYHFDNNTAFIKKINTRYQEVYNKPANDMVYRGYELIVWYGNILKKYGTGFQYSKYDNIDSPYTPYEIQAVKGDNGHINYFENQFLYIYKYNNGIFTLIEPK